MTSICPLSVSITGMRTGGAGGFSSGSLRRGSICHRKQLYHFESCKREHDKRKDKQCVRQRHNQQEQAADPRGTTKATHLWLGFVGHHGPLRRNGIFCDTTCSVGYSVANRSKGQDCTRQQTQASQNLHGKGVVLPVGGCCRDQSLFLFAMKDDAANLTRRKT